jgi:hypothetical protein
VDWLFVDEAGQVGLANMVAMARAARNIVLVGDPRQLPQVIQGAHWCCHVWTACLGQGCKFSFGSRQGSVMCPAC